MDFAAVTGVVVGICAAIGGLLKLVFDALQKKDEAFVAHLNKAEERQEKFLGNHLSSITRAQTSTARALAELVQGVERVSAGQVRAAEVLAKADMSMTRKVEEQNRHDYAKDTDDDPQDA